MHVFMKCEHTSILYEPLLMRVCSHVRIDASIIAPHSLCSSCLPSLVFKRGMSLGDAADRGDIDTEGSDSEASYEVTVVLLYEVENVPQSQYCTALYGTVLYSTV